MRAKLIVAMMACVAIAATVVAQANRPLSPEGTASAQVLGKWVKPEKQAYAMGGERYEGGKWIDITYGVGSPGTELEFAL